MRALAEVPRKGPSAVGETTWTLKGKSKWMGLAQHDDGSISTHSGSPVFIQDLNGHWMEMFVMSRSVLRSMTVF